MSGETAGVSAPRLPVPVVRPAVVPGAEVAGLPDVDELERRLRERATESTGEIGERIALARDQLEQAHKFRYMVRNDDLERATAALAALVECELDIDARSPQAQRPRSGRL